MVLVAGLNEQVAIGVGDLLLDAVYGCLDAVNGSGVVAYGSASAAVT